MNDPTRIPEEGTSPPGRDPNACSDDGVDLTLIRWMLTLTPAERLQALQNTVRSIETLRRARRLS